MPNHTYTEVRLQGDLPIMDAVYSELKTMTGLPGSERKGFLKEFIGDPGTMSDTSGLDDLIDLQDHPVTEISRTMPHWYEQRLKYWGTKWDVYHIRDVHTDIVAAHAGFAASRIVTCKWETAWSPCIPAMLLFSAKYGIDVQLKYLDEGLYYAGHATIINGEINHGKDYDGDDVYRGIYEVFGKDHFIGLMYDLQIEYLQSIMKLIKRFADRETVKLLKQHIKTEMAA